MFKLKGFYILMINFEPLFGVPSCLPGVMVGTMYYEANVKVLVLLAFMVLQET